VRAGSPFLFHVDAVNSGYVTAYGPGLSHGVVHEPAYFTINTKEAGAGTTFFSDHNFHSSRIALYFVFETINLHYALCVMPYLLFALFA
jgi:hypothetical protein